MTHLANFFFPFLDLTAIRGQELWDRNRKVRELPWIKGYPEKAAA